MRMFNNQVEILHSLLNGTHLIYNNETIFAISWNKDVISRDIHDEWNSPNTPHPMWGQWLADTGNWDIYSDRKKQEFLNRSCENRWCWVSDEDPNERTIVVKIKGYFGREGQEFFDEEGRFWKYATKTDRWERIKWGYYSAMELE